MVEIDPVGALADPAHEAMLEEPAEPAVEDDPVEHDGGRHRKDRQAHRVHDRPVTEDDDEADGDEGGRREPEQAQTRSRPRDAVGEDAARAGIPPGASRRACASRSRRG